MEVRRPNPEDPQGPDLRELFQKQTIEDVQAGTRQALAEGATKITIWPETEDRGHPTEQVIRCCSQIRTYSGDAEFEWQNADRGPGFTAWLEKMRECIDRLETIQTREALRDAE